MLTTVIKTAVAIETSIQIMSAFVKMRKFIYTNQLILDRIYHVELKQIKTDERVDQLFSALEQADPLPHQGIFYNGQIFDAYKFASNLIKKAGKSIILIDNYIDEDTLAILAKRSKGLPVIVYTEKINSLDVKKWESQYGPIEIRTFKHNHDRFLIIDKKELYHIGASLKDLGKKLFAFSRMDKELERLMEVLEE